MTAASLLQRLEQPQQQIGARLERGDQHVLVLGMGAGADDAETVERRDAERGAEIAVAAAARRHLGQRQVHLVGDPLGVGVELGDAVVADEGRAVDAAGHFERDVSWMRRREVGLPTSSSAMNRKVIGSLVSRAWRTRWR